MFEKKGNAIKKGANRAEKVPKKEQVQMPLSVRVTKGELRFLKRSAKAGGESISNWIRGAIQIRIETEKNDKEQSKTKRAKLRSQTELGFE